MTPTPTIAASQSSSFRRARVTSGGTSGTPTMRTSAQGPPLGEGVLTPPSPSPSWVPSHLTLVPFGTGADNATFTLRVFGWRECGGWVPVVLFEAEVTLSTAVGVAGGGVTASERFADTIADPAAGKGTKNVDCVVTSPADNTPAQVVIDCKGCQLVEVRHTLGTATAANALYAWL